MFFNVICILFYMFLTGILVAPILFSVLKPLLFLDVQAMEIVALPTEYFLESCDLMSCAQLVVSHLLSMTHAWTFLWIWNLTWGALQSLCL